MTGSGLAPSPFGSPGRFRTATSGVTARRKCICRFRDGLTPHCGDRHLHAIAGFTFPDDRMIAITLPAFTLRDFSFCIPAA